MAREPTRPTHDHRTKNLRGVDLNSILVLRACYMSHTSDYVIPATVDLTGCHQLPDMDPHG